MAELNLKQITDKLNSEFTGDVRKLVFWYDANAEFQEDIDTIELENAKKSFRSKSRKPKITMQRLPTWLFPVLTLTLMTA